MVDKDLPLHGIRTAELLCADSSEGKVVARLNPALGGVRAEEAIKALERVGGARKSGKGDRIAIRMTDSTIARLRGKGEVRAGRL